MSRRRHLAYITKLALTKGISVIEVEDRSDVLPFMVADPVRARVVYYKGEWHHTAAQALAHAETLRCAERRRLHKAFIRLEALNFGVS